MKQRGILFFTLCIALALVLSVSACGIRSPRRSSPVSASAGTASTRPAAASPAPATPAPTTADDAIAEQTAILNDNTMSPAQRMAAVAALLGIGGERADAAVAEAVGTFEGLFQQKSIVEELSEPDRAKLVKLILDALPGAGASAKKTMTIILGNFGGISAVQPLLTLVKDGDAGVRREAAVALAKMKDPSLTEPYLKLIDDPLLLQDPETRGTLIITLANLGDKRAVDLCIAIIGDKDDTCRGEAAIALGVLRDARAVKPLIALFASQDNAVRDNAQDALIQIGGNETVDALIQVLKNNDGSITYSYAQDTLIEMKGEYRINALAAMMKSGNREIRSAAASTLGVIGNEQAAKILFAAQDKNDLVAVAAAHLFFIGQGRPGSEAAMAAALKKYGDDIMATAYVNTGNKKLEKAGEDWAHAHGFEVVGNSNLYSWGSDAIKYWK